MVFFNIASVAGFNLRFYLYGSLMKKALAISVAFMYLAITSGLVLQIHYCMGKEVGSTIALAGNETHKCSQCGMENAKNKCCHDDVKIIKLQDVHQQVNLSLLVQPPPATEKNFNWVDPFLQLANGAECYFNNLPRNDEPIDPSLFLLHGVIRI